MSKPEHNRLMIAERITRALTSAALVAVVLAALFLPRRVRRRGGWGHANTWG